MSLPADTNRPNVAALLRIAIWAALVAACVVLLAARCLRARDFASERSAWEANSRRVFELGLRRTDVLRDLLGARPQTRAEAERRLNGRRPLESVAADDRTGGTTPRWTDPETGRVRELTFSRDYLTGYGSSWALGQGPVGPPPIPPEADRFETYRRLLVGIYSWRTVGPTAWALLLVIWAVARRHRRPLSELLLATAVICTTFRLARPGFVGFTGWKSIFGNDPLVWAALMLAVSGGCVIASYRLPTASPDLSHPFDWRAA